MHCHLDSFNLVRVIILHEMLLFRLYFCALFTPFMNHEFLENWVFAILELSFWIFGTEFSQILNFLGIFSWFLVKIFGKTQFLSGLKLSFWLKTEFFGIFGNWVFENPELSFLVLYKKKACTSTYNLWVIQWYW